jgi:hypothetical protein
MQNKELLHHYATKAYTHALKYSTEVMAQKYLETYDGLLAGKSIIQEEIA